MKRFKYPLLIILSAVMYGISPALTKMTYSHGGNGLTLAFFTPLFSLPFLFAIIKGQKATLKIDKSTAKKILTLSLCGGATAMTMLFFAYERISTGLATTLHFIYPVVVAFGLVLFFKEKLSFYKILALVVAVAGIALMSLDEVNADVPGILIALLSGVMWAFFIIYIDKSGLTAMNSYVLSFYSALMTSLIAGVVGLITGQLRLLTSPAAWAVAVLAGIVGRVIASPCFQRGVRGTGPLAAGILSTFEPITSVVVGILVFHESATVGKIIGCFLVIAGVCLIVYANVQDAKAETAQQAKPVEP